MDNNHVANETSFVKRLLNLEELVEILGLTIKHDDANKLITFLAMLSAYTENSQLNISFNAPSSTGKTYIPTELAQYFPIKDVISLGHCSAKAFFYDFGKYDKDNNQYVVDLSRKIIVFLDQPHMELLQNLRPLLSHDKKEITVKVADKTGKHGTKTKNIILLGFPSVVFCSAGLRVDEQESTRFILLSPEASQEKITDSILEKLKREANAGTYKTFLEQDVRRSALKKRIELIKTENIEEIKLASTEKIEKYFLESPRLLKPRHARDVGKVVALVKAFALLNLWFREREGQSIVASDEDIEGALKIWRGISESQEYNLPPYIYEIYTEIILPCWNDKRSKSPLAIGVSRNEIMARYIEAFGKALPDWQVRQQIIPIDVFLW